jgi:cell wall assembly regulator SMI1
MATSQPASIEASWSRIVQWLKSQRDAAHVADELLPGAPDAAAERVEATLGERLPDDVRQFWRVCGGSRPDEGAEATADEPWWQPGEWGSGLFPRSIPHTMSFSVLSPRASVEAWERLAEWEGFERHLLPIATDGGGDYQCVTVSAASGAARGRVVEWGHEECIAQVLASSLSSFLQQIADGLANGSIVYEDGHGLVRIA